MVAKRPEFEVEYFIFFDRLIGRKKIYKLQANPYDTKLLQITISAFFHLFKFNFSRGNTWPATNPWLPWICATSVRTKDRIVVPNPYWLNCWICKNWNPTKSVTWSRAINIKVPLMSSKRDFTTLIFSSKALKRLLLDHFPDCIPLISCTFDLFVTLA